MTEAICEDTPTTFTGNIEPDTVIIAGNSHRYALCKSWDHRSEADVLEGSIPRTVHVVEIPGAPLRPGYAETKEDNEAYWTLAIEKSRGRIVLVSWLGNSHSSFLFQAATKFALLPDLPGLPIEDRDYVPFSMAQAFFEDVINYAGGNFADILERLTKSAKLVLVVGTPPPKSGPLILRGMEDEPGYIKTMEHFGAERGEASLTPLSTRFALWQALQAATKKIATSAGCRFIDVPASAHDETSALLADYSADDVTHANHKFGALMWAEIMKAVHA